MIPCECGCASISFLDCSTMPPATPTPSAYIHPSWKSNRCLRWLIHEGTSHWNLCVHFTWIRTDMAELGMDAQLDPIQKLFIGDKLDIVRSPNQTDCPMTSLAKLYRFGHIFFRWQIQRASILDYLPEEVSVEVTNVCNFKCAFCPQSQPDHHDHVPKTYLEPEAADLILRRLREGGIQTQTLH